MNFWKRHIGDYVRATAHLDMLEDGAYGRLLDLYYAEEQPLPPAPEIYRKARARTPAERKAVDTVLAEFFTLTDSGWAHRRCDAEIASASAKAEANRENGRRGGRPKREPKENPQETQSVSEQKPKETLARLQTPDSKTKNPPAARSTSPAEGAPEPDRPPGRTPGGRPARPTPDAAIAQARATEAERIAEMLRTLGMPSVTSRIEAVEEMAELKPTDAQLAAAVERARKARAADEDPSPINAGFVLAKLRRVMEGAPDDAPQPTRIAEPPGWRAAAAGGDFRKADDLARALGCYPARGGESGPAYVARIDTALGAMKRGGRQP